MIVYFINVCLPIQAKKNCYFRMIKKNSSLQLDVIVDTISFKSCYLRNVNEMMRLKTQFVPVDTKPKHVQNNH